MSLDWFEALVVASVSMEEASAVKDRAVGWLADRGITLRARSPNDWTIQGLSSPDGLAYEMGPRAEEACGLPPTWNDSKRAWWRDLRPNGVDIAVGGIIACSLECGYALRCPSCNETRDVTGDALGDWEDKADASLACNAGRQTASLDLWDGGADWAFGRLALTFFNWPQLKDSFKSDLGASLDGRVVHTVFGR